MFGMQTLDVAIGLIFVYLLLALICTGANELLAGFTDRRTKKLMLGIRNLLYEAGVKLKDPKDKNEKDLATLFFNHPLVKSLKEDGTNPSYIPSRVFALTVLDIFVPAAAGSAKTVADIKKVVAGLPETSDVRRTILLILEQAGEDIQKAQALIETWFNDTMDRISACYKQKTQWTTLLIAVIVTGIAGADTIQITKSLINDPAIRTAVVAQAQESVKNMTAPPASSNSGVATPTAGSNAADVTNCAKTNEESLKKNIATLKNLGLKLGWEGEPSDGWLSKIAGLLITAFAASVGAPFWFDLLNKFMSIRAVGKSPAEQEKTRARQSA